LVGFIKQRRKTKTEVIKRAFRITFYVRLTCILIIVSLLFTLLVIGQNIFMPVLLSLLFSILLRPVVKFLNRRLRFPHVIAVLVSVVLFILFLTAILVFVSIQVSDFASDIEHIKSNLNIHYHNIQHWISTSFDISIVQQDLFVKNVTKESL